VRKLLFLVIAALFLAPAAIADTGIGVEAFQTKKFAKALKELTPAAKAGDPEALRRKNTVRRSPSAMAQNRMSPKG
jgi:hypothetical protein